MLYPNARHMSLVCARHFGPGVGLETTLRGRGDRMSAFVSNRPLTTATPDGYGLRGTVPPYIAGEISGAASFKVNATGNPINALLAAGTAALSLDATGNASLFAYLSGLASLGIDASANVQAVVSISGSASLSIDATASPTAFVNISGNAELSIGAAAVVQYTQNISGTAYWAEQTGLTAQDVKDAVWNALATDYNDPSTMGNLLNLAGSGGVDYNLLADAVLVKLQANTIPTNVVQVRGYGLRGSGQNSDPWGPV